MRTTNRQQHIDYLKENTFEIGYERWNGYTKTIQLLDEMKDDKYNRLMKICKEEGENNFHKPTDFMDTYSNPYLYDYHNGIDEELKEKDFYLYQMELLMDFWRDERLR